MNRFLRADRLVDYHRDGIPEPILINLAHIILASPDPLGSRLLLTSEAHTRAGGGIVVITMPFADLQERLQPLF